MTITGPLLLCLTAFLDVCPQVVVVGDVSLLHNKQPGGGLLSPACHRVRTTLKLQTTRDRLVARLGRQNL